MNQNEEKCVVLMQHVKLRQIQLKNHPSLNERGDVIAKTHLGDRRCRSERQRESNAMQGG